ncbi:hypothetical protein CXG50_18555 [Pseudomonas plecoglossicida]|uniref:Uncharacterized protein n=1 Tax=Pseudomonas plecoglossicida TaxID=70775 RepID=A0ABX4UBD9_PSEDL|nr:hypothetical protein CSW00_19090 [Pseudomonas sp. MR 02]PLP92777.1 hypothetical protein CX682_07210 [Pseudomonas sp. FFUP_PS_41]PLU86713.1 hypothetical protein CXG44_13610 [Pseudomonas plecoglossicida]QKK97475.1 hypothetical protein GEV38_16555 [Pseudomonas sp. 13159349]TXI02578.1 MAG: hypothetical protein E6Q70_17715 [Pseudomonas monteilii]
MTSKAFSWRRSSFPDRPRHLLRGHARSHRYCTRATSGAVPVGAGEPAMRPVCPTAGPPPPCPPH